MKNSNYELLTEIQRKALDEATKMLEYAYNPYSHFSVGACLYAKNGDLVGGANFANAAYGDSICAERAAILRANAMGLRKFSGIAILAKGESFDTSDITAPCGSCRQVLYEMSQISGNDLEVVLSTTKKDKIVVTTVRELLPLGFGPEDLKIGATKHKP
jgi:cytidine deaminase